ncbi:MAG: MBL fold metallo-hydrolase [Clostridia bacterium]|nr:MBL fold metallo-hydrolase [Clostridia bacterium]
MEALAAFILFVVFAVASGPSQPTQPGSATSGESEPVAQAPPAAPAQPPVQPAQPPAETPGPAPEGKLQVYFLDVGQADSILVKFPGGQTMLVDAGNNDDGPGIVSYLKQQGVKKIDYLVATHPHSDHLGGMDTVINAFPIGKVYMPKVAHTTKTYEDVLRAIQANGLKVTAARAGVSVLQDGALSVSLVAPCGSGYEDLNDWSAVVKIKFGSTAFLLAGDARGPSESEMLTSGADLKADVLKVGHHGSRHSTTSAFLKAVSPKYAVISVGAGNPYGHPAPETLAKLEGAGIQVFRTDRDGTILAESDGKTVTVKKLGTSIQPRAPNSGAVAAPVPGVKSGEYIGNRNSKIFHRPTCTSLPEPQNRVIFTSREEAIKAGYRLCKRCRP